MGRLVVGIELLLVVVALAGMSIAGALTPFFSLAPLVFTAAVPLFGSLMIWKPAVVTAAFRDAFSVESVESLAGARSTSLRVWEFFEYGAYVGGILGILLTAIAVLSRIGQPGPVRAESLWTAAALVGLYAILFGTLSRILRGIVETLSKKPLRELDVTLSEDFIRRYSLTPRECEVIGLVLRGRRYHEAAAALFISIKTVKTHVYHVYEKTSCRGRMELIRLLQFTRD